MNTQALLRLIDANERAAYFCLARWFNHKDLSECTGGCLVGNDYLENRNQTNLSIVYVYRTSIDGDSVMKEYGVTSREYRYLFSAFNHKFVWCPVRRENIVKLVQRDVRDKQAAINRVRKFIYYKLHKKEMLNGHGHDTRIRRRLHTVS